MSSSVSHKDTVSNAKKALCGDETGDANATHKIYFYPGVLSSIQQQQQQQAYLFLCLYVQCL